MITVDDARALLTGRASPPSELGAAQLAVNLAILDKLIELFDLLSKPEPEPKPKGRKP